jgi:hypothetical protein
MRSACGEPEFAVINEFLKLPQIPPGKLAARLDRFVRLGRSSLQQPADRSDHEVDAIKGPPGSSDAHG